MRDRRGVKIPELSLEKSTITRPGRRNVAPIKKPTGVIKKKKESCCKCSWNVFPFLGASAVLLCLVVATGLLSVKKWNSVTPIPRALTPFPGKLVSDLPQFQGEHKERLFWGTYRSSLYLGIRARTPKSLLAGLMWLGVKEGHYSLRHTCEESDKLSRYAWVRHDGATYGRQEIVDQGLAITTSFLKSQTSKSGYGGDWAVRVRVTEKKFLKKDEAGTALKIFPEMDNGKFAGGTWKEIGGWELHVKGQDKASVSFVGLRRQHTHNLTQLVWQTLEMQARTQGRIQLPDTVERSSNIAIIQITGMAPLDFDVVFVSGTNKQHAEVGNRVQDLSGVGLSESLVKGEEKFEQRFQSTFQLQNKGSFSSSDKIYRWYKILEPGPGGNYVYFSDEKVQGEREIEVGRVALSNLLGSLGYFYGQSLIAIPPQHQVAETKSGEHWKYWPAALYTAVPSRSFFPRGFLWDEGFHQLLVSRWDRRMSKEIIAHWLDLLNIDGWIPREQILGDEARRHVLISSCKWMSTELATIYEAEKASGQQNEEDQVFFERLYPRLEAWFQWFNTSQTGKVASSYYWHGRNAQTERELNPITLMSGLDDYPRASHPSDDERHLDLRCWLALAAQSMTKIAFIIDAPNEMYEATASQLRDLRLLNKLHYDNQSGRYLDYGLHTEEVKLHRKSFVDPATGYLQAEVERLVIKPPELGWVPHYGYNSLFPLLMDLLPLDSPAFKIQLDLLHNELHLWTDYGLRSLATTSSLYMKRNTEHDAPYWRGPVWMNINYLVLSALERCSKGGGEHSTQCNDMKLELRSNLIRNVVKRYHESGYLWEQYDNANKGKGKGSHPFTGWTSLILLIMGDMYWGN